MCTLPSLLSLKCNNELNYVAVIEDAELDDGRRNVQTSGEQFFLSDSPVVEFLHFLNDPSNSGKEHHLRKSRIR